MVAKSSSTSSHLNWPKRAFAPAVQFNEAVAASVERLAKFQYELAGDLLQLGIDQMNATVRAKDLPTLLAKQREIATKFAEKNTARQQALSDLASDSQASVAKWFEDTASFASGKAAA